MKVKLLVIGSIGLLLIIYSWSCQSNTFRQGEILYQNFCANCHMDDGTGLTGIIPPLAGADYLKDHQEQIPCIIRNGMKGEVTVNGLIYKQPMPGTNKLSPFEIANIINYVNSAWGNDYGYFKFDEIQQILDACPYDYGR